MVLSNWDTETLWKDKSEMLYASIFYNGEVWAQGELFIFPLAVANRLYFGMSSTVTQTCSPQTIFYFHLWGLPPENNFSRKYPYSHPAPQTSNCSFSLVIACLHKEKNLTYHNTLTAGYSDINTLLTDAYWFLEALYALKAIFKLFHPWANSLHLAFELLIYSLGVLRLPEHPLSIHQHHQPSWDITYRLYTFRLYLPTTITVLHVQGHQDSTTSDLNSLSLPAHLNIVADSGTHQA